MSRRKYYRFQYKYNLFQCLRNTIDSYMDGHEGFPERTPPIGY